MSNGTSSIVDEGQIYGWLNRVDVIDEEIRTLTAEKEKLARLIEMAEQLSAEASMLAAINSDMSSPKFINEALAQLEEKDAFPKAVMAIIERSPDGASYDDLKQGVLRSPLAGRFRKSDKGFYHAIRRLKIAGAVEDYRGFLFTPENLKAFLKKVEAGLKNDKTGSSHAAGRATKMTAMILEIVAQNPGMIAKEVIDAICARDSEIAERLEGNDGSAYNAIARFKKRGEIEGYGHLGKQLRLGPNASQELKRLERSAVVVPISRKTEAPNGKPAGASDGPLFGSLPRS